MPCILELQPKIKHIDQCSTQRQGDARDRLLVANTISANASCKRICSGEVRIRKLDVISAARCPMSDEITSYIVYDVCKIQCPTQEMMCDTVYGMNCLRHEM